MLPTMYDSRNKKHLKTRNKKTKPRMGRHINKKYGGAGIVEFQNARIQNTNKNNLKEKICSFLHLYRISKEVNAELLSDTPNPEKSFYGDSFGIPQFICGEYQITTHLRNLAKNVSIGLAVTVTGPIGWALALESMRFPLVINLNYTIHFNNIRLNLLCVFSNPMTQKATSGSDTISKHYNTAVFLFWGKRVNQDKTVQHELVILSLYSKAMFRVLGDNNIICDCMHINGNAVGASTTEKLQTNAEIANQLATQYTAISQSIAADLSADLSVSTQVSSDTTCFTDKTIGLFKSFYSSLSGTPAIGPNYPIWTDVLSIERAAIGRTSTMKDGQDIEDSPTEVFGPTKKED